MPLCACRSIKHIQGDRNDYAALKGKIGSSGFDVVYDVNGREAEQASLSILRNPVR